MAEENGKEKEDFLRAQLVQVDTRNLQHTLIAVLLGFGVGGLLTWIAGYSPVELFSNLIHGALGGRFEIGSWLSHSTPIIFTSLAFLIVLKSGLYNIGAEGQLYIGAFAAAWAGFSLNLPPYIHVAACLLIGAGAGAAWGFIPGILKAKRGANEFVTSLMLSYIAIYLTRWFVSPSGPYHDPSKQANMTLPVDPTAQLSRILKPSQLTIAFFLAVIAAIVIFYLLRKTTLGYEIRVVGTNQEAAKFAGISINRAMVVSFALGGALAGLAGAGVVIGDLSRFIQDFSPGYGWDGIAGALIGRGNPIGAIFASLLIGFLRAGAMRLDRVTAIPFDIVMIIEGLIAFFVIAPGLIKYISKRLE